MSNKLSHPRWLFLVVFCIATLVSTITAPAFATDNLAPQLATGTADHSKFAVLDKDFASGPEVTRACLGCHTEAAKQIQKTKHWKWEWANPDTGQLLGKKTLVNNYCISAGANLEACPGCHIGYGWKDKTFDFSAEENVDCLVCHDTTSAYDNKALRAQDPGSEVLATLREAALNVGPTSRDTCGNCHFKGGGAEAVKHGDLDPSLKMPDFFLDVHMDADGLNFTCSTCHSGDQHDVKGSRYTPMAAEAGTIDIPGRDDGNRASCTSCHGGEPHPTNTEEKKDNKKHEYLNKHVQRVACQTCHIPEFSRGDFATKMWWDWSTAAKFDKDGKPYHTNDDDGLEIYNSKKGDFRWEQNVVPEYVWFNGKVEYTLLGDKVDPTKVVPINKYFGSQDDPESRLWPVKVMRGKQPYDSGNNTLAVPKTVGKDGFWKTFDWASGMKLGMEAVGMPYSGKYGFIETEMLWPISHMVAPADEALVCKACHGKEGRMVGVVDFKKKK
jgi:octaheme c-type cytochrome (tetrathionate reductase family)